MDFTDEFEESLFKAMPVELQTQYTNWKKINNQKSLREFLTEKRNNRTKFDGNLENDPIFKTMDSQTQFRCRVWIAKNDGTPQDFLHEYHIARNRANTAPPETVMAVDGSILPVNGMSQEEIRQFNLENVNTLREARTGR